MCAWESLGESARKAVAVAAVGRWWWGVGSQEPELVAVAWAVYAGIRRFAVAEGVRVAALGWQVSGGPQKEGVAG